ncbi:DMT family transporter [Paenibacillus montanisoli]|uniref:EamA/RhaT family transporter n=1 Tax=Paenibacillus montanisoli TaxID=2081970 RepID=A0A328U2X0_9BACL|nr:DMT family transporter [Paenibacillus montanisoli]RAP77040.1 EamA/RhaT family transporter [Paenibacillus montanisoli]
MGYLLLLLATLAWSFVGVLVKTASTMVDSSIISFARFFFGVIFLGIYLLIKDRKIRLRTAFLWIWIGAAGKAVNYIFENIALSIGFSYGNILVQPVQTVVLLFTARLLLKEEISARGWVASALCVLGVLIIGWNGLPLGELLDGNGLTTLLYMLAGIGAAVHVWSQRVLVTSMDAGSMNFSVFLWSSLITALPIPVQSEGFTGPITFGAWGALIVLGIITGLSFLSLAEAIKRVPFAIVAIVGNCSVFFTILWSYLFFHEPITEYIISGTLVFVAGFLILNLKLPSRAAKKESSLAT